MIGDHKQLRPKCQHYPLTVESNRGLDLNRSLFERLAIAPGFRLATLGVQHRMHPDISCIPRLVTYNDLADAPTVSARALLLGLDSRVIFVNHEIHEDEQHVDTLESVSKTNAHERAMIVKTVQYVLTQGYAPDDIVVLTPYLGQMMKLHAELAKSVGASLDERDLNEAREQFRGDDNFSEELAAAKQGSGKTEVKPAIRVATIDNYQGEEANIVLVSLVRSNETGQIGFLKEPERVNVMLSRARDCEIIFGNRATLERAKGTLVPLKGGLLWKKIFSHLESSGRIFEGLPVVCQNHRNRSILSCPKDFDRYCCDGGCSEKCIKKHNGCDHPCQRHCHPGPCPKCPVLCPDVCSRGHALQKRCSAEMLPKCHRVITWTCPMGHMASGPCHKGTFGNCCKICNDIRQEEEACVRREEELNKELEEKHLRLAEVKSKLVEAKQSNTHRRELKEIENELALAQKELDGFLALEIEFDSRAPTDVMAGEGGNSAAVIKNVLTLLQKQHEVHLSNFSSNYRDEFESVFEDDIEELMPTRNKKRRKIEDVLKNMPFCEIIPRKKIVRLRDGYNMGEGPLKQVKLKPDVVESDEVPVTASFLIGDQNLEYVVDASTSYDIMPGVYTRHSKHAPVLSASSVPDSILSPVPTVKSPPIDCEDTVALVLRRYVAEGALKADDLLDEISIKSCSIDALRFMMELELNPGKSTSAPLYKPTSNNLTNAVLLTARALDLWKKYPLQARDLAQKALSFIADEAIKNCFPKSWVADLESICTPPLNPSQPPVSPSNKVNNTASEAWLKVKSSDPKAPRVMGDSILPMIGLEAVKESLLSMYHRFKLSQEQGDGAATSYNVRFEGNPGLVHAFYHFDPLLVGLTTLRLTITIEQGKRQLRVITDYFCNNCWFFQKDRFSEKQMAQNLFKEV